MCLDGKGNETIARTLQENEVLIPYGILAIERS